MLADSRKLCFSSLWHKIWARRNWLRSKNATADRENGRRCGKTCGSLHMMVCTSKVLLISQASQTENVQFHLCLRIIFREAAFENIPEKLFMRVSSHMKRIWFSMLCTLQNAESDIKLFSCVHHLAMTSYERGLFEEDEDGVCSLEKGHKGQKSENEAKWADSQGNGLIVKRDRILWHGMAFQFYGHQTIWSVNQQPPDQSEGKLNSRLLA